MRSIWTGAISFGLIYIPVRLYSATEASELDLDMLRKGDLCPIRYVRVCKETGDYNYTLKRKTGGEKLTLKKYCPTCRKHTEHNEKKK